jgi:peptide/nickel transport system substrate-binding protein
MPFTVPSRSRNAPALTPCELAAYRAQRTAVAGVTNGPVDVVPDRAVLTRQGEKVQQTHRRAGRTPGLLIAAGLVSLGLVAAACGSDSKDTSPTTTGGATATTAKPADTTAAGPGSTAAATTEAPTTTEAAATPTPGGKLTMGIEAETGSPWTPAEMTCAISCHQVARSVYDPLTLPTKDGKVAPYLAKSVTPNADYTVWTIVARDGVTFHDGTPFDGAAILDNLTRQQKSFLTGKAVADIKTITLKDPMTVEITMGRPWVVFPIYLAGQIGYMASPTWLAASDADATLKPKPVGTGPFVFESYKPGENFIAKKNPNYWNKPYPYLDEIEFRVYQDALTRKSALEAGDIDIMHTTNGDTIAEFRKSKKFPMEEVTNFAETGYTLLNVTKEGSPLTDSRVRCAMAYAYDSQAVIDKISSGVNPISNGPFSDGQLGHEAENGYPLKQDMAKAKELVAAWKADNPGKKLEIELATTQDQTNLVIAQAQQQWFMEAGFDTVTINQIEQAKYILTALQGNFDAFQWRNHGGIDLDAQYIWWHSSNALPPGQLALNFGRIKDPVIDKALDDNRGETDPAKKKALAETVDQQFAKECYNLWGSYTVWGIPHTENVHIADLDMPDGQVAGFGAGISGTFSPASIYITQ